MVVFLGNGGQYSSEVAFALFTQLPRVRFPFSKNYMLHCLFSGLWQLIGPIWYKAGLCKFSWGIVGDYYYKKNYVVFRVFSFKLKIPGVCLQKLTPSIAFFLPQGGLVTLEVTP